MADVTITTTDGIDGRDVTEYLDVVSGEAAIGANVVSDIAAGIRDVVGGRSGSSEKKVERGREEAIADLRAEAEELGADAVVGASFDTRRWPRVCSGSTSRAPPSERGGSVGSGHSVPRAAPRRWVNVVVRPSDWTAGPGRFEGRIVHAG